MNIVISAHFDIARPVTDIVMDNGGLHGLVDNFAGVFVAYEASKATGVKAHFTNFEELEFDGADKVAKEIDKETLVIVVDTTTDANGKSAYLGNAYDIDLEKIKGMFKETIEFKDGLYEKTEDETWIYGNKYGLKTFYFGVPINGNYHDTNNFVSKDVLTNSSRVLIDLIKYFQAL